MKKYLILIFVALAAVFQSCDNNDDLWDAIDDLKSRVQALETQVDALNGNIEALQKLYGGATISKVETSDGKYGVTLTNGETIELVQGSEAVAVIPIVSINDKGEWQVSTDNGATFTSLGVKAVAEETLDVNGTSIDCVVIENTTVSKVIGIKQTAIQKIWYGHGIGPVKTNMYNKKGKLMTSQELVSIEGL